MADNAGKMGIGIIGYGGFGEFLRRSWDEMDNARVVAVCDSDPTRAPVGDVEFHEEVGPMLASEKVDIVSIATPPNSHRDLAIMALEAGKHVLIEKPVALTAADGIHIKEAAQRTGRVATVDFMLRYNPVVEMLVKLTQSEVLGKIRRVDLRNYAMLDQVPEDHWFWNPQISGRILVEHGVHFFDLARSVVGANAADVWSLGVERKPGIEDRVFAAVKYENDVVGTFWHSFSRPRLLETTTFHFVYDLGEVDMLGWIPLELNIWGWTSKHGLDTLKALGENIEIDSNRMEPTKTQSSEHLYDVEYDIDAKVRIEEPKLDIYADNVRAILADMIKTIENPSHKMRVTMDDAIEAVRTAEMATTFAHPEDIKPSPLLSPETLRP